MARRDREYLLDNPPPGSKPDHAGLLHGELSSAPSNPRPPQPVRSAAAAAAQRKDKLKRDLAKKRTQVELQKTSGQQGSMDRKRVKLEEEEANRFRRSRR